MSRTSDAIDAIRDQLTMADDRMTVTPAQIGHIMIAVSQLVDLVERMHARILDLERVQNERCAE